MGALDVSREDFSGGTLSLTLEPVGRRHRRVYVTGASHIATWRGAPVAIRAAGRAAFVELDVGERGDLVITFAG